MRGVLGGLASPSKLSGVSGGDAALTPARSANKAGRDPTVDPAAIAESCRPSEKVCQASDDQSHGRPGQGIMIDSPGRKNSSFETAIQEK